MLELMYILAFILIYLFSFLYRRISILVSFILVFSVFQVDVYKPFVLGLILVLTLIRFKKSGLKDEI